MQACIAHYRKIARDAVLDKNIAQTRTGCLGYGLRTYC
jgi:hypothetical protein